MVFCSGASPAAPLARTPGRDEFASRRAKDLALTELLARVSARRPWLTIGAWVALMIIASALNVNLLESATTTEFRLAGSFE